MIYVKGSVEKKQEPTVINKIYLLVYLY